MLRPILGLLLAAAVTPCAYAAQSYDNCTGVITSLPATISTQGTWCLKGNLVTTISTGNAITVATNNVTIDCNDFKVGGLPAGDATNAVGVFASDRLNTTIRNCGIRGFMRGILLEGDNTAGTLIEDNRLDNNTYRAIEIYGSGHVVRNNRVVDTGGRPNSDSTVAIQVNGSESLVSENLVSGLTVSNTNGALVGIHARGGSSDVARNLVTGIVPAPGNVVRGISMGTSRANAVRSNTVLSSPSLNGIAITATSGNICSDNKAIGYSVGFNGGCGNGGGNANGK